MASRDSQPDLQDGGVGLTAAGEQHMSHGPQQGGRESPILSASPLPLDDMAPSGSTPCDTRPSRDSKDSGPRHDWAAALDLIAEASEAVMMAEQRTREAEQYTEELELRHVAQVTRIEAAERRAEAAERRADEAETWLQMFYDTIMSKVKPLVKRETTRP